MANDFDENGLFKRHPGLYKGTNPAVRKLLGKPEKTQVAVAEEKPIPDGMYTILNIPGVDVPNIPGVDVRIGDAGDFQVMVPSELARVSYATLAERGIEVRGGTVVANKGSADYPYNGARIAEMLKNTPVIGKETLDFIVEHATPKQI